MTTTNNTLSNIVSSLENRINTYKEVQIPTIKAIAATAAKFNGKVLNRRFTAAVTKALESNANRVRVDFNTNWDNTTDYDIIKVNYCQNGTYGEFRIYPDRMQVKDYTDEDGRLVAEKLIYTCNKLLAVIAENIETDEKSIKQAAEFVTRVESIQTAIKQIDKDFPLALRAKVHGSYEFCR